MTNKIVGKLIPLEPKKLFWTKKQHVFIYLDEHPEIRTAKELCFALPYYVKATLYNYFNEWRNKNTYSISAFIGDIYRLLFILNNKYSLNRQLSMKELESIRRLGDLIDKYSDKIEELKDK